MSTIIERKPRLPEHTEAGVSAQRASRAHGLSSEWVMGEGDPADAVRSLTPGSTQILQEG